MYIIGHSNSCCGELSIVHVRMQARADIRHSVSRFLWSIACVTQCMQGTILDFLDDVAFHQFILCFFVICLLKRFRYSAS